MLDLGGACLECTYATEKHLSRGSELLDGLSCFCLWQKFFFPAYYGKNVFGDDDDGDGNNISFEV